MLTMLVVKKTRAEATALKASHAAKERLRRQRREEQEENVRRKMETRQKGLSEGTPESQADARRDEMVYEEEDAGWDEEEEISDVDGDGSFDSEQEDSEEEHEQPPRKKTKFSMKR